MRTLLLLILLPASIAGCDLLPSPPSAEVEPGRVTVQFAAEPQAGGEGHAGAGTASAHSAAHSAEGTLVMTGPNGTLTIDDVRLIVAKFKLKRARGSCQAEGEADACGNFKTPPFLLDLPLGRETAAAVTDKIPYGTYSALAFTVRNLKLDRDVGISEALHLQTLFRSIEKTYPQWPPEASMVVTGSFTPAGGIPQSFTVFAEAEVEVALHLDPPLVLSRQEDRQSLTVRVDPAAWFSALDGSVADLSAFDYERTGELLAFEARWKDSFSSTTEEAHGTNRGAQDEADDEDDDVEDEASRNGPFDPHLLPNWDRDR